MELAKKYLTQLKRLPPVYIFLIAVLPIFLSILIHTFFISAGKEVEHNVSLNTEFKSVKDDGLGFQLNRFITEQHI